MRDKFYQNVSQLPPTPLTHKTRRFSLFSAIESKAMKKNISLSVLIGSVVMQIFIVKSSVSIPA
jgi:hypothetical protein